MSKFTVAAALVATIALGACAKHRPAAVEPAVQPIFVEPAGIKGRR